MIASVASDTIAVSTNTLTDFRSRQITGELSVLQDSPPSLKNPESGKAHERAAQAEQLEPLPEPTRSGSMFAAAVIAGALAPTPQTIEEVYARIGSAWIPQSLNCGCATSLSDPNFTIARSDDGFCTPLTGPAYTAFDPQLRPPINESL